MKVKEVLAHLESVDPELEVEAGFLLEVPSWGMKDLSDVSTETIVNPKRQFPIKLVTIIGTFNPRIDKIVFGMAESDLSTETQPAEPEAEEFIN